MTTHRTVYRLDLTPHQRAALLTVLTDYIAQPDSVEVSIDAATGNEIDIGHLLALVMDAPLVTP